jgi:hypothetical protein
MPRINSKPSKPRHDPLHVELQEVNTYQKFGRVSKPGKRQSKRQEEDEEGGGVSFFGGVGRRTLLTCLGRGCTYEQEDFGFGEGSAGRN